MERSSRRQRLQSLIPLFFNLLEGDGSAGALEHHRPSKVSSRNEVKDTDRSSPYWRMPYYVDNDILTYIPIWHYN